MYLPTAAGLIVCKDASLFVPSHAHGHSLRPSTNCYKLSVLVYAPRAWGRTLSRFRMAWAHVSTRETSDAFHAVRPHPWPSLLSEARLRIPQFSSAEMPHY